MSAPESDADEIEIPLGRYARRVVARWYIVVATIVVALVIAWFSGSGSSHTFSARTLINLGAPFGSSNQPINSALGINPVTPGTLIHQEQLIQTAARAAGIKPGALRGGVSSQPVTGAVTKTNFTPIVGIVVQGPWGKRTAIAADSLASQVLAITNRYPQAHADELQREVARLQGQVDALDAREKAAQVALNALPPSSEKALLQVSVLNGIGTQRAQLESTLLDDRQQLLQVQDVELGSIVTHARPVAVTASGRSANYGVAVLLGAVVGVALTLLSYAVWRPRRAASS